MLKVLGMCTPIPPQVQGLWPKTADKATKWIANQHWLLGGQLRLPYGQVTDLEGPFCHRGQFHLVFSPLLTQSNSAVML